MKPHSPEKSVSLTIGELAERTGVPQATLRTWESRYGSPRPQRLPAGHRRYGEDDVRLVERIVGYRDSGLSMHTSVAQAKRTAPEPEPSVFAGLRRRHPLLAPSTMGKRTLLALTRAIEDESWARAEQPILFAAFQHARFYQSSRHRYADLARTAKLVVILADFSEYPAPESRPDPDLDPGPEPGHPIRVPLPATAPLLQEWLLVCDAREHPACLTGRELPGQRDVADADRRFEALWTIDPPVVRDAARICARLVADYLPTRDLGLDERLADTPPPASSDVQRVIGLINRTMTYVDTAVTA